MKFKIKEVGLLAIIVELATNILLANKFTSYNLEQFKNKNLI